MSRPLYDHKLIKAVNICLPDSMIEQLDEIAGKGHQSRSAIIRVMIENCIKREQVKA